MKRFLNKSPFWSGPYASLKLRMPGILQQMEEDLDGEIFSELAHQFDTARRPKQCHLLLGSGMHAEVQHGVTSRRTKELIYHFDADSQ